jgi:hypothetical protein
MCQPRMASRFRGGCACGCCGCGCGPRSHQSFAPLNEHERLEKYRDQLQRELAAVGERIKECDCC